MHPRPSQFHQATVMAVTPLVGNHPAPAASLIFWKEAANENFSSGLGTAYSGSSTSTAITGRSSGTTYYYRVKATRSGYSDSSWGTGSNGCVVTITAGAPSTIAVPSSASDGSYTVSWGSSSTSSVTYILEEATDSSFSSDLSTAYSGSSTSTTITDRSSGTTYYYRVKATRSGYTDSSWRTGSNGCVVTITAGTPSTITVPSSDSDGSYTVSWGSSSTGSVTYILEEATNESFRSDLSTAYSGPSTSTTIPDRSSGTTYYYRVKATRSGYTDSSWCTGSNGCVVSDVTPAVTIFVSSDGKCGVKSPCYDSIQDAIDNPATKHNNSR